MCLSYGRIIADKTGKTHPVEPLSPAISVNFGCLWPIVFSLSRVIFSPPFVSLQGYHSLLSKCVLSSA